MTEQPYTPTEARVCIDYCNAVVARRKIDHGSLGLAMEEADAEFDRFIAQVKADAWGECATEAGQWPGEARHVAYILLTNNPYKTEETT